MSEAAKLSDELDRFADGVEQITETDYAATPEGAAALRTAIGGVLRMFAHEARTLEADLESTARKLLAADCRIQALTVPDYLSATRHNIAIREGVGAGKVIDLRELFWDEQEFNAARSADEAHAADVSSGGRDKPADASSDGDAA